MKTSRQLSLFIDEKVNTAIDLIIENEPPGGYFCAFSGGKDSITIENLLKIAGVKYTLHNNITSVDPPPC